MARASSTYREFVRLFAAPLHAESRLLAHLSGEARYRNDHGARRAARARRRFAAALFGLAGLCGLVAMIGALGPKWLMEDDVTFICAVVSMALWLGTTQVQVLLHLRALRAHEAEIEWRELRTGVDTYEQALAQRRRVWRALGWQRRGPRWQWLVSWVICVAMIVGNVRPWLAPLVPLLYTARLYAWAWAFHLAHQRGEDVRAVSAAYGLFRFGASVEPDSEQPAESGWGSRAGLARAYMLLGLGVGLMWLITSAALGEAHFLVLLCAPVPWLQSVLALTCGVWIVRIARGRAAPTLPPLSAGSRWQGDGRVLVAMLLALVALTGLREDWFGWHLDMNSYSRKHRLEHQARFSMQPSTSFTYKSGGQEQPPPLSFADYPLSCTFSCEGHAQICDALLAELRCTDDPAPDVPQVRISGQVHLDSARGCHLPLIKGGPVTFRGRFAFELRDGDRHRSGWLSLTGAGSEILYGIASCRGHREASGEAFAGLFAGEINKRLHE